MATDLGKVGMVDKGNYNSASTYETMDVVTYNSSTYIAIQAVPANTAPTNTSYWREAFGNAIIGTSSISNVASSITEAIGNTALFTNETLSSAVMSRMRLVYGGNAADGTYSIDAARFAIVEFVNSNGVGGLYVIGGYYSVRTCVMPLVSYSGTSITASFNGGRLDLAMTGLNGYMHIFAA